MQIQGYAFTPNEVAVIRQYQQRYAEISHLAESLRIKKRSDYGRTSFEGELTTPEAKQLTELDLALIADNGNLCFGGSCKIQGDRFVGSYCTD